MAATLKRALSKPTFPPLSNPKKNKSVLLLLAMEHNTSPLNLEDVLLTIFRHIIVSSPSAVASILFVNKKWNKAIRSLRVWHPHPLSIPPLNPIHDTLNYDELHYYIIPLLDAEIEAQISQSLQIQRRLYETKKRRKLYHIPADNNEWRQQLTNELNTNIAGLSAEKQQFIQSYMDVNLPDYRRYCCDNYITTKQFAVMLAITSNMTTMRPSWVMDVWPGVKHLFKSRDQLEEEASITDDEIKMTYPSYMSKIGLWAPEVEEKTMAQFGDTFKRLTENNFSLSTIEVSSQTKFADNYHTMNYYSWLTFLSQTRWVAIFYIYNSHEHDSYGRMFCVKGDNSTGKSEVFDIKDHYDLDPYSGAKGDDAVRALYEISDEDWKRDFPGPEKYSHDTLFKALSGARWDFFEMLSE